MSDGYILKRLTDKELFRLKAGHITFDDVLSMDDVITDALDVQGVCAVYRDEVTRKQVKGWSD